MGRREASRRLIVTADDFGASASINEAVVRAHREGVLTAASLMVTGDAAEEAVELARQNPRLGVGLHLTLVCGRACGGSDESTGLVGADGRFTNRPVSAGFSYYFRIRCRQAVEREVAAQFARFRSTGLELDHVNGHLHFHMHPTVLGLLVRRGKEWGIEALRVTRDPLWLNLRLRGGRYGYRLLHYMVFACLSCWVLRRVREQGWAHTERVFGLLQDGRVDGRYVERLIERLPPGDTELYSHPSVEEGGVEFEALRRPGIRRMIEERQVGLIRYQDL